MNSVQYNKLYSIICLFNNNKNSMIMNLIKWFCFQENIYSQGLNLRSKKWILGCSYNHLKENISSHFSNVTAALDKLCTDYENIILLGDFNVEVKEKIFLILWLHITWKD